jgi:hypothetical protein
VNTSRRLTDSSRSGLRYRIIFLFAGGGVGTRHSDDYRAQNKNASIVSLLTFFCGERHEIDTKCTQKPFSRLLSEHPCCFPFVPFVGVNTPTLHPLINNINCTYSPNFEEPKLLLDIIERDTDRFGAVVSDLIGS